MKWVEFLGHTKRIITLKPTERFSDRVDNYRRYRPGYPMAVIDLIRQTSGVGQAMVIHGLAFTKLGPGMEIGARFSPIQKRLDKLGV
jgi:hypothetical protein